MTKKQLIATLNRLNLAIDRKIITNKPYRALSAQHLTILKLINHA